MSFGPHLLLALLEGTLAGFVLALTALGLSLVFGVMRIVNVAHGEFFMLGAVLAWAFSNLLPDASAWGFLLALVASPLVVGAIAFAVDGLVLRRLKYNPEATIVATIGLLFIIEQMTLTFYGPYARPVEPPIHFRVLFPWFGYSGYKFIVMAASAALLLVCWFALMRTRIGLLMRATQYDRETAQTFAIPVTRVYSMIFVLGAILAAVAGVLVVPLQQAYYLMGMGPLLLSFTAVIIGGLGSLRGTVMAAFVIGINDGVISVFFSPTLAKIIATLLVALVLVFRPAGLFPGKS